MAGLLGTIVGQVRLDIRQAVAAYGALRAQNARTMYALRGTGEAFTTAGRNMTIAGLAMVYGFGKAVQAAADFERKMDFFGAVTDTNKRKMAELSEFTLQLAQDTIFSGGEIADAMVELGKAGVSAEQIMQGVGRAVANLGAAGDIPLAESAQIITSAVQTFDLSARDAVRVADLLAGAANASIVEISDLGFSLKYAGGVASAIGIPIESLIDALSLLGTAGIRGSTAGTSLRQIIVSLGGATGPATEALEKLGIITENGSNKFFDAQGNAKDLSRIFQILQNATDDLTKKQKIAYLRTIFNNRALSAAAILTREGAKGFASMNKEIGKTTAAEVAHKRLDNLSGDLEILRGNIETLFIKAGTPFQDMLRGWVQSITKLVQAFGNLPAETQKSIIKAFALTGVILVAVGAFTSIIGWILRFVSMMIRMGAAISFVMDIVGAFAATVGLSAGALIAIVLAVAYVFAVLYKNSETFRNAINTYAKVIFANVKLVAAALRYLIGFFVLLYKDPAAAWEKLKHDAQVALDWLVEEFHKLPGQLSQVWSLVVRGLGIAWQLIKAGFLALMPILGNALVALGQFILAQLAKLPPLLGQLFMFLLALAGRGLTALVALGGRLAQQFVNGVINFIKALPRRLGFILGFMVGIAIRLFLKLLVTVGRLTLRIVQVLVRTLGRIPGLVQGLIIKAALALVRGLIRMVQAAISNAPKIGKAIINALIHLPGQIIRLFGAMVRGIWNALPRAISAAEAIGLGIFNAISGFATGLPGVVGDIISNMIGVIKDAAGAAFDAVKDFAGGMWDGFKSGLGIGSPSYMERAMWQISGVLDTELKKQSKMTMDVQRLSKTVGKTQFKMGGTDIPTARELAKMTDMSSRARRELSLDLGTRRGVGQTEISGKPIVHKTVEVKQTVNNPKPEKRSDTAVRTLHRIAQVGLLEEGE